MIATTDGALELVRAGRHEIRRRDFELARTHLEGALHDECLRAEVFNLLGVLDEVQGAAAAARTKWRIALLLDPAYEPARENLARSMSGSRRRGVPSLG
jgi:Flp pilus assembly protein TadD